MSIPFEYIAWYAQPTLPELRGLYLRLAFDQRGIAFSMVSSFTNVVRVPPEGVPQSTNDLRKFLIGSMAPDPPRPPPRKPPKKPGQDQWTPTTDEEQALVPLWLKFCQQLGLEVGGQTNVADVNWDKTFKADSGPPLPPKGTDYNVVFRNGTTFGCVDRTIFGHCCGDAAFVGAWAHKPMDSGKIKNIQIFDFNLLKWEEAADPKKK